MPGPLFVALMHMQDSLLHQENAAIIDDVLAHSASVFDRLGVVIKKANRSGEP